MGQEYFLSIKLWPTKWDTKYFVLFSLYKTMTHKMGHEVLRVYKITKYA